MIDTEKEQRDKADEAKQELEDVIVATYKSYVASDKQGYKCNFKDFRAGFWAAVSMMSQHKGVTDGQS